ncbi:hypothetical protein OsI_15686 [Oryza sativa Indica Group]|uniref:Uncharacterized protein n=1 Tax=Oryza sativa subsp. indica TaxID=39946 RepID=A2XSV3_ORYSI|nr:hypothetical protein OsI_15686 [Oryza sativa Indica Group]
MEHSKEFIDELHKPLTAEAKAQMVADGKKKVQLQEKQEEDGTALRQGSRLSATDLIRYTLMGIRFAFTAAMHYYHCTQMQIDARAYKNYFWRVLQLFSLFFDCYHYSS